MDVFWAVVTIAVVVAIAALAVWAFLVAPIVVPGRSRPSRRSVEPHR
jgi:hypothetical protein